jgi:hypothetical protein
MYTGMLVLKPKISVEKSTWPTFRRTLGLNQSLSDQLSVHCFGILGDLDLPLISIMVLPQRDLIVCSRAVIVPTPSRHCAPRNSLKVVQTENVLQIRLDIFLRLGSPTIARIGLLAYLQSLWWGRRRCLGRLFFGKCVRNEGTEMLGWIEIVGDGIWRVDRLQS